MLLRHAVWSFQLRVAPSGQTGVGKAKEEGYYGSRIDSAVFSTSFGRMLKRHCTALRIPKYRIGNGSREPIFQITIKDPS